MLKAGRPSQDNPRKAKTLASLDQDKTSMRRVNFDLSAEEFRQLKIYAAKQDVTLTEIFRQHVASLINARS